ncbi:MAG: biopolymer transporter ExbD [Anaeromyxobacteraceae bacterium]
MSISTGGGSDETELEGAGGIFADINITPLTDIFLVLLIIFMVTTTAIHEADEAKKEGAFKVNLPKGAKGEAGPVQRDLTVAVLANGTLVLSGKPTDEAELGRAFADAHEKNPETLVLFQADEGVPHGRVVAVMELARKEGLSRLAIATRAEAP